MICQHTCTQTHILHHIYMRVFTVLKISTGTHVHHAKTSVQINSKVIKIEWVISTRWLWITHWTSDFISKSDSHSLDHLEHFSQSLTVKMKAPSGPICWHGAIMGSSEKLKKESAWGGGAKGKTDTSRGDRNSPSHILPNLCFWCRSSHPRPLRKQAWE